jgi:long-chain fatty acid transport protein
VLLCACTHAARANPADVLGFGSRAAAMGSAGGAIADDAAANYYNPAGLARGGALRIDLGYQGGKPYLSLNGHDSGVDSTHGFAVGLVAPFEILGARIAFGAALFLPDDRLARTRTLAYAQPRWVYYDNRTQRIYLAANVALRVVRGLYVGAGMSFMSRTEGTASLRGNITVTDTDTQSQLESSIAVDLVAVRYPQAGIVWEAAPWLTLAASYRHSFVLKLDQAVALAGSIGDQGERPIVANGSLTARSISLGLFQPWQLTASAAVRFGARVLIAYDLVYARWSEFDDEAASLQLALDVGKLSSLVHLPPPRNYPPPRFHDVVIPRVGVEVRALEREKVALDVRAGYSYEASPVPEQIGESNYVDADKHRFSVGAGVTLQRLGRWLGGSITLDAHFAVTALPPRANRKADPTDPVGDYVGSGAVVEGGLTNRWVF